MVFERKLKLIWKIVLKLPLFVLAIPIVFIIRFIKPWLLVRFGCIIGSRIGHLAGNIELYLCERDAGINVPVQRHLDFFYIQNKPICNIQLVTMWKRLLRILPNWILVPIVQINNLIPGGEVHDIGSNTMHDQDVHNLFERSPPHLQFTVEERVRGEDGLQAMGIPKGTAFVCLMVRDSAYLAGADWTYHSYRNSDIQNYILAADELASRGYYVIRMGAKVHEALKSVHSRVIDYATNGMRSDFMDIYLGAECAFCISTSTGWDAIPYIFRRPIVYVNLMPLGYLFAIRWVYLAITKHHVLVQQNRELTLQEIFSHGIGFSYRTSDFESKGVQLVENTPEEIRDVAVEMIERLNSTWQSDEGDEVLQKRFWAIFPKGEIVTSRGQVLCTDIRSRYGAKYLRHNRHWLQ